MKHLLDAVRHPEDVLQKPAQGTTRSDDMLAITQPNGQDLWLSRKEAGAAGYREVTNAQGQRVVQFGLCRDAAGAWVYPPLKAPNETLEDVLERSAAARRRVRSFCPKKREANTERGWRDE